MAGRAAALGDPLEALPHGRSGRPELPVEVVVASDAADDGVQRDRLDPEVATADATERVHHVVEAQQRIAPAIVADRGLQASERVTPARTQVVVLRVGLRKPGVTGHATDSATNRPR